MQRDIALENQRACELIIDQLVQQGVHYFCISPGSRNTPLVLAVANHPAAKSFLHFDERALGFHALGYAKASKTPVAIIVTSGTAVGNLFPAVMEASLSFVPIIVLTADRPPELRDNGSNQTLDQVKLFGDYVRWEVDLPPPDHNHVDNYLRSTIAQALIHCNQSPKGPVHLNCMFREPLVSSSRLVFSHPTRLQIGETFTLPSPKTLESWAEEMSCEEKGVIIVGSLSTTRSLEPICDLAERLGWPIFADVTSNLRSVGSHNNIIPYFDAILKGNPEIKPDVILHLGDRYVSKTLRLWLARCAPKRYYQVKDHPMRADPEHLVTQTLQCDPVLFSQQLLPFFSNTVGEWLHFWREQSARIEGQLDDIFAEKEELSEPYLFYFLAQHAHDKLGLFVANSMPIRDADNFFFPKQSFGPLFANRGVSGIDGNIATAVGAAQGCGLPIVAVLGDLTSLHDLTSLAQLKKAKHPLILIIVNNDGGAIYSFLPIAQKSKSVEEYFALPHGYSFEEAARLFGIYYAAPKTREDFEDLLLRAINYKESCVIEITTNRSENYAFHKKIADEVCSLTAEQAF